jgi:hypothetical protein
MPAHQNSRILLEDALHILCCKSAEIDEILNAFLSSIRQTRPQNVQTHGSLCALPNDKGPSCSTFCESVKPMISSMQVVSS